MTRKRRPWPSEPKPRFELKPRPAEFRGCAVIDEQKEMRRSQSMRELRQQFAQGIIDDEVHMEAVRDTVGHVDELVATHGREEAERLAGLGCWRTWLLWERLCRPKDARPDEDRPHLGMRRLIVRKQPEPRCGNELLAREIVDNPDMHGEWWVLPGLTLEAGEVLAERRLWGDMPVRDGRYRFETRTTRQPNGKYGLAVMLPA